MECSHLGRGFRPTNSEKLNCGEAVYNHPFFVNSAANSEVRNETPQKKQCNPNTEH